MLKDTDLHLYLDQRPPDTTFGALLDLYGFSFLREAEKTKTEPLTSYYQWAVLNPQSPGLQLLYFDTLFSDDLNFGSYESFIILSASRTCSATELSMVDVMAVLLLSRYGGRLHNPQRIEKISTSYLLSGDHFSSKSKSAH